MSIWKKITSTFLAAVMLLSTGATNRLATFAVKVKTPGNIAHKYYTDIVSAMKMKKNKEG